MPWKRLFLFALVFSFLLATTFSSSEQMTTEEAIEKHSSYHDYYMDSFSSDFSEWPNLKRPSIKRWHDEWLERYEETKVLMDGPRTIENSERLNELWGKK